MASNNTNMNDLFDDDDDDDDSDEEEVQTQTQTQPAAATAADDDDDDDDDAIDDKAGDDKAGDDKSEPKKVDNAQLFGSDSDDSDDEPPPPAVAAPVAKDTEDKNKDDGDGEADADAAADKKNNDDDDDGDDAKSKKKDGDNDNDNDNDNDGGDGSDSDAEFKADDITGRKRAPKPKTFADQVKQQLETKQLSVPNMPLPQFKNNRPNGNANGNGNGKNGNGKRVTYHMAQLPKIVAIQPDAYNRNTYNASVEEAEFGDHAHASMIRWRYKRNEQGHHILDENGKKIKESNAKIVKWSDGTYGLCVGKDVFNMDEFNYTINANKGNRANTKNKVVNKGKDKVGKDKDKDKGKDGEEKSDRAQPPPTAASRISKDFVYLTQKAEIKDDDGMLRPAGTILECVTSLQSKFIPRPATLQSDAHKKFVLKERQRMMNRAKIAEYVTFEDPEKQKADRIRNKDDMMKQEKRGGGGRRSGGGGGGRRRYGMNRSYMDDDDEHYDSVNIRSMKKSSRMGREDDMGGYDDEGGYEDNWSKRKRSRKSKHLDMDSESEEEMVVDDEDDDEEQVAVRKKGTPKKSSNAMFDSDSE
eukprot:CAMPEP_0194082156 /NCGR_PEP_ID=MMETSP0149-20130528/7749_1 /TAXON_ID=122233 /ORGANISM="Chaetoceros debilis, Strain MM31A-1" /LENGTH=584 /DNA_ID=CAMNT_0038764243 /DNA_START=230 /DNA_END=1984 /DNA_ORIENTATION=+